MPNQRLRLASFLLVSGAAHALGLSIWGQEQMALSERSLGEPVVTVTLAKGAQAAEIKSENRATSRKRPHARQAPATTRSPPEAKRDVLGSETIDEERRHRTDDHNALLGEIRTRLSQHLSYPPLARHRGWQGEVLLGFAIELDGRLSHIRVARSSGYDILDKSALDSLSRIGYLTTEELSMTGPIADLRLPVIYRLTEN
jgi:protein TonB